MKKHLFKGRCIKSVVPLLLSLCLVIGLIPMTVLADEDEGDEIDYTCGEDAQWYIEDGTLYITGTGAMYDYDQLAAGPWRELYVDEITSIVIEEGITYIGTYAFWYMYNVTSVSISSTVETIAQGAFDTIYAEEIVIPESVTYIGFEAFVNCEALKSLVINAENITIDTYAFWNCNSLESLVFNSETVYIGEYAFYSCTSLESIEINAESAELNHYAFIYCTALTTVEINAQAEIYECAFFMCPSLSYVYVESGSVYDYAFENCYSLSEISGGAEVGDLPVYNVPVNDSASYSSTDGMTICYTTDLTDVITVAIDGEALGADDYSTEYDGTYTYIYIGADVFSSLPGGEYTVSVEYEYNEETYSDSFSITIEGVLSAAYEDGVLTLSSDYNRTIYYGDEALEELLADIDLSEIVTLNIEGYIYYIDPDILSEFENLSEINVSEDCMYEYEYSDSYEYTDDDGVVWTVTEYQKTTYGIYTDDDGILYYIYSYNDEYSEISESGGWATGGESSYGPVQLWPEEETLHAELEDGVLTIWADEDYWLSYWWDNDPPECLQDIDLSEVETLVIGDNIFCIEGWILYYMENLSCVLIADDAGAYSWTYYDEWDTGYYSTYDYAGLYFDEYSALYYVYDIDQVEYDYETESYTYEYHDHCLELIWVDFGTETYTVAETVTGVCDVAFADCADTISEIYFTGDAPGFDSNAFQDITATIYYPEGNETWTEDIMQDYAGNVTWVSYDPDDSGEEDEEDEEDEEITTSSAIVVGSNGYEANAPRYASFINEDVTGLDLSDSVSWHNGLVYYGGTDYDNEGGTYYVTGTTIIMDTDADGSDTSDFGGLGAAVAAIGDGVTLYISDSYIETTGVAKLALYTDDGAVSIVTNSSLISNGGVVYDGYYSTADTTMMVTPPWVLGLGGDETEGVNARTTNIMGTNSVGVYIDSYFYASGWGALSTDNGSGNTMIVINTKVEVENSGYGAYTIGETTEEYYGATMDVSTYAIIMTGGEATFESYTAGQEIDVYKMDGDADEYGINTEGTLVTTVTSSSVVEGTVYSTITSDNFGFMCHSNGSTGYNVINILDGTSITATDAIFLIKKINAVITVDDATLTSTEKGVILQIIDNDDDYIGVDVSVSWGMDDEYGHIYGSHMPTFNQTFSEESGYSNEWIADTAAAALYEDGDYDTDDNWTVDYTMTNTTATGDIWNSSGYVGSNVATTLNVTLGEGADLTGLISAGAFSHDTKYAEVGDGDWSGASALGHVTNIVNSNGVNIVNVTLTDDAVWTVDADSCIDTLTIEDDAVVYVEAVLTVGDTVYEEGSVITADGLADKLNGLCKNSETGIWAYYTDGVIDTSYTGLADNDYGTWYIVNGYLDTSVSGLTKAGSTWVYLTNGMVDTSYTGLAKNDYGWWYVNAGYLDTSYTGLADNDYGTWYVSGGTIDTSVSGLTKVGSTWVYLNSGMVYTSYTGLAKNDYGWWYVNAGYLDLTYTGMAKNAYGWWYVTNGQLDTSYTGLAANDYGTWYMVNGALASSVSGLIKAGSTWVYLTNGMVNTSYTGLADNDYGTWYINAGYLDTSVSGMTKAGSAWVYLTNGMVDTTYTGLAKNDYGWWYINAGYLDLTYTGMAKNAYGWWYVTNGKLDLTYTGMAKNDYGWWYMTNGSLDLTYTGLAANDYGTWYMVNGKLTYYTGTVTIDGMTYTVTNGKVVS